MEDRASSAAAMGEGQVPYGRVCMGVDCGFCLERTPRREYVKGEGFFSVYSICVRSTGRTGQSRSPPQFGHRRWPNWSRPTGPPLLEAYGARTRRHSQKSGSHGRLLV